MKKEIIGLIAGHSGDSLTDELHENGLEVALVCGKDNEPGSDRSDFLLITNLTEYETIVNYFKSLKIRFVVIGTGHYLAIELADKLEKAGFKLNINYANSVLAKEKVKFKECLIKLGILTPKYLSAYKKLELETIKSNIGIPCVIKSAIDKIQPRLANTEEEVSEAMKNVLDTKSELLVEEYIDGNDCTVAVDCCNNEFKSLGCLYYSKAKEYKLIGFTHPKSTKMNKDMEQRICEIAERVATSLNYTGVVRIDFIIKSNDIYVLELNSVLVTGYKGSARPFFERQNINISKIYIDNALKQFGIFEAVK